MTASLYENEKGDPAAAIERFKKIAVEPWQLAGRAAGRRDGGEGAHGAITPRTFRSGETAHLKITTRNLEKLTFTRLQAQRRGLFPQEARARAASSRSISAWSRPTPSGPSPVPGYARYKPVETDLRRSKKLEIAGRLRGEGDRREDTSRRRRWCSAAISTPSSRPRATRFWSSRRT